MIWASILGWFFIMLPVYRVGGNLIHGKHVLYFSPSRSYYHRFYMAMLDGPWPSALDVIHAERWYEVSRTFLHHMGALAMTIELILGAVLISI